MKKNYLRSAGTIIALLISATTIAQTDTVKTKQLNTVVISATRSEKKILDIGRSVTIITQEELKNSIYNNVADVLAVQEGISIIGASQNPGSPENIFMRGTNSNHTLIMIDGMPLSDPSSTNRALDLSELLLTNIERIEIVRGSHSTLYGSSAIGGVINIITKKKQKDGFNADVDINGGTFGKKTSQLNENVFLNYTFKEGFYANINFMNEKVNGLDATVDTVTNPLTYNHRDRDNSETQEFQYKLGFKNKKWDVYAADKIFNRSADIDKSAYTDDDNYTLDVKRNNLNYGVAFSPKENLTFKLNAGYSYMKRYAKNDSSIIDNAGTYDHTYYDDNYEGHITNEELTGNYRGNKYEIVAGAGLLTEAMTAQHYYYNNSMWGVYETKTNLDTMNINVRTDYAFLHAELDGDLINDYFKPFTLAFGGRFSSHQLFGNNFTYEINPSLKLNDNTLLFASYSTGFNAPSLYQLYTPDLYAFSGIIRGNKNLKPETSQSIEAGIKQNIDNKFSFSISVFWSQIDNTIEYVYLWNKNKPIDSLSFMDYLGDTYLNIGKLTNRGIEISLRSRISDKFNISGNISLVGGKLDYDPQLIDTSKTKENTVQLYSTGDFINKKTEVTGLVRRPNTANISFDYAPIKPLLLKLDVKYIGAKNDVYYNSELGPMGALSILGVQDYMLLDFTAKYNITKALSAVVKVENLLNQKYVEVYGFATRGRGVYLSLRYVISPGPKRRVIIDPTF